LLDWLDAHAGSVQALATFVLVGLTAYYAWFTRALVQQTRATLQARLDRVSELLVRDPELFRLLDDPGATGHEEDARFHVANILVGVLEEAHIQYAVEHSMTEDDWRAWVATADMLMPRRYLSGYWQNVRHTFSEPFRQFVDERLAQLRRLA
jgi:hypothetical protein